MHTRDVVLCYPKRTPVGRYGGALKSVPVQELASLVVKTIVEESGIDPTLMVPHPLWAAWLP